MNRTTSRRPSLTVPVASLLILGFAAALSCGGQSAGDCKSLYQSGQVFALREAAQRSTTSELCRGAVLSSLNNVREAVRVLDGVIKSDQRSESAYQARDILGNLYQRNGLYKEALQEINAALSERPDAQDIQNIRPLFELLAAGGDMKVMHLRPSKLTLAPDDDIPFSINGHADSFAFDTGSVISFLSEGEAVRLGLSANPVSTKLSDASGTGLAGVRVAVAKEMHIGGLTLQNVPFMVLPDSNQPFASMPAHQGHRGLIGLPILLAMRSIRWTPKVTLEFDLRIKAESADPNLLFYQGTPVINVIVKGRALNFALDTGADVTDLNPIFATDFPDLMALGKKDTNTITGFGGSKDYTAVLLPSVALEIGGKTVTLTHPHVSVEQGLGGGSSKWAGNLGDDALVQARHVTFDFRNSSLHLE